MQKNKRLLLLLLLFIVAGCRESKKETKTKSFVPVVCKTSGYRMPEDSISLPVVVALEENKLKKTPIGNPKVFSTANIQFNQLKPIVINAGKPKKCRPGSDGLILPKTVPAIDSPFIAGMPEIIIAKDPYIKDQNPQNIGFYTKLQGLLHDNIRCIIQDRNQNIWIGSDGGVSRFDGKFFTHFTEKEGLSNNIVYCLMEDKDGAIWMGTDGGGVTRFDGKYFTHFREKDGLSNDFVRSIFEDKKGNIWIGTDGGGISLYNKDAGTFTHYTENEGLSNNVVRSIIQDDKNNLWFGTYNGACKFDGEVFTHYTKNEGLCNNYVLSITQDRSGNFWFGTYGGGVSVFDGKTFTNLAEKDGFVNNNVYSIIQDKSGDIWLGMLNGGVTKLHLYENSMIKGNAEFIHYTESDGLGNNTVLNIFQDCNQNIWFGTYGGGLSVLSQDARYFKHYTEKQGLNNSDILSIVQDKEGEMWFGTNGGGVFHLSKDFRLFTQYTEKEGLCNNIILSIYQDSRGNMWFGTDGGGVSRLNTDKKYFTNLTEKEGLSNNRVYSITEDNKGNLWFGTDGGACLYDGKSFTQYDENSGLSSNYVFSIKQGRNATLWFGTYERGVTEFDGKNFTVFSEKEGLINNYIIGIIEDKKNNLWFVTDIGLSVYNGSWLTSYKEITELTNNTLQCVIFDSKGNLWLGKRYGLSKIPANKLMEFQHFHQNSNNESMFDDKIFIKTYTSEDGFFATGCNRGALYEDNNGNIWIGSNNSLNVFQSGTYNETMVPPNIQLTGLDLFNERIPWIELALKKDSSIKLGNGVNVEDFKFDSISSWYNLPENVSLRYDNNNLTFNFISITQHQNKKVRYKYMLDGIDENWSSLTSNTSATYGNLPNGSYKFKVKALNSEGNWSKELIYSFRIRPPWWKTWWFQAFEIIAIILLVISFIKLRERKLKKDRELLARKVKEQTKELKKQNEEIESQKNLIENKNKKITDSIRYAERIQHAILPPDEKMKALLNEYFVYYLPKDIVSGDFYWVEKHDVSESESITMYAAVDCTGHGVPGAFMSLLGYNGLSHAVKEHKLYRPADILDFLSNYIREMIRQRIDESIVKDGMDLFLCSVNKKTMQLEYAGVHNSAYIIRKGEIIQLSSDTHPIGENFTKTFPHYSNKQIAIEKGDCIYLFTDGYIDQFGGTEGKKFFVKPFKRLLLEIQSLPMNEQKKKLVQVFEEWKKNDVQTDDVLVMGIRI
jgi:two-component system sensor histidine kinase ChiS